MAKLKFNHELTDEMLQAFGTGKLKVERVEDKPREFRVAYDAMQIDNEKLEIRFLWTGIVVATLDFSDVHMQRSDTLTIQDMTGFVPFKLVR